MQFTIKHNFPDVQRQIDALKDGIAKQATVSAVNKVAAQAKTAMSKEIRAEFNISAGKVGDALRITRATAKGGLLNIEATLDSPRKRGRSLNLINFMERSVSMAQARKRGKLGTLNQLHVQIKKAGGRKALGSAFIGNKGRTVFVRVGKARLPIKALQTIDVASMFNTRRVNGKVLAMIQAKFPEVFANEVKFFTNKFNSRAAR